MDGGSSFYGGSAMSVLVQRERLPSSSSSDALESLWVSNPSPYFHGDSVSGSTPMVDFKGERGKTLAADQTLFRPVDKEETGNDEYDGCFRRPEKKRRLTLNQVHFLEKSFEVENKLEPDRKIQLAKELGLQPRQVAIWFQNRRARYKTKQIEKDYDCLKANYDRLKDDFDSLLKENEELRDQVNLLKGKVNSEPIDHQIANKQLGSEQSEQILDKVHENPNVAAAKVVCKQEDASSAKSDVFDSESPNFTEGHHSSSMVEPADSSHVCESEDEEDNNLSRGLFQTTIFPKLEDCSNLGCPIEDHDQDQAFWFWTC